MSGPVSRLVFAGEAIVDLLMRVPALPGRGADMLAESASVEVGGGFNIMAAAARQGLQFAEDDSDDLAILHSLVAQAALETGERSVAAQACADFHRMVQDAGRDHVEQMLAGAVTEGEPDPFERIRKVEAELSLGVPRTG